MMLQTKYQGSRPCGFRQESFSRFPYISLCKTSRPRAYPFSAPGTWEGDPFWPNGDNLNKLSRGQLGDVTYQISSLYAFVVSDKKIFSCLPYISLCKRCDPLGVGAGPNFAPGAHAWIFFKLCILITHDIRTMKMYLSN